MIFAAIVTAALPPAPSATVQLTACEGCRGLFTRKSAEERDCPRCAARMKRRGCLHPSEVFAGKTYQSRLFPNLQRRVLSLVGESVTFESIRDGVVQPGRTVKEYGAGMVVVPHEASLSDFADCNKALPEMRELAVA